MRRKACLIFNPVSGTTDADQDLERIKELLSPQFDLDIQFTTEEISADKLAQEAVKKGEFEIIIAAGGDGTLSETARALGETTIPLGIIPRGTANAFASALGLPDTLDEACETILSGKTRRIDIGRCNGKLMTLLAGIGFEAETVENASREAKQRWGVLAYLVSGIQQLRELELFEAEIETDDKIIKVSAGALTVANAAPPTSVLAQGPAGILYDDGLLDVTIISSNTWGAAIAASYHLLQTGLRGDAAQRDDIGYLRTKRVKITTNPPQKIVLDGEMIGNTPLEVECIPGGLSVIVPMLAAEKISEKLEGLPDLEIEEKSAPVTGD
ncbi:YegS/Rv2252/BmrU family lipid kinase [Rivularia sp. UHCC 0363]|uniref:YegS/Rv2252/BmrU family lipid kinase n=1 Tax=Rivularia sp. UHCC 0363 TaxID=3110244 RepID=UPI002B20901F|nr:YegS/Rv2252/BmrU family lipid kinase [Rivularia sp. UHCC 0363]MEA5597575.1 YegS/Rv2252/BmrU family lipid kinase [Rivularia sp. UHCC 0363]